MANFPPSCFGGISVTMGAVVDRIAKSDPSLEVKVFTTLFETSTDFQIEPNVWIEMGTYKIKYIDSTASYGSLKYIVEGCRLLRDTDQLHLSSIFFLPSLFFAFRGILVGKKVFWSVHGELMKPALYSKLWKKAPYLLLVNIISPWIIFRATSQQEALRIKKVLPFSRVRIIPNIIATTNKIIVLKKNQFIYLGRIARIKQLSNIIKACVESKHFLKSDYIFMIIGPIDSASKGYYEELKSKICKYNLEEKVILKEKVISPEKEILLAESRALFLASKSENFGNVVVEALQQGTPAVASTGTPWESLNENKCGLWIENSPIELAKALDFFIEMDKPQYEALCSNAIKFSKKFQQENIIPSWEQLIKE